jgi:hypothetical protein
VLLYAGWVLCNNSGMLLLLLMVVADGCEVVMKRLGAVIVTALKFKVIIILTDVKSLWSGTCI